jgi:cell division protein FtsB
MSKNKIISVIVVVIGIVAVGAVSYTALKENRRTRQIDLEIDKLKAEAEKIEQGNEDLQDKISYLETTEFEETVAKEKMNLQKPGEKVVIIKPSLSQEDSAVVEKQVVAEVNNKDLPNYQKWWNQFFLY